jgi:hypothetical protein
MATFDSGITTNPEKNVINNPLAKEHSTREGSTVLPQILEQNPQTPDARRNRQLIMWRVPGRGFVKMYMNPQQLQIQEKKIIQKERTKGGYVIQYWGEELPTIKIDGNTGAAGIEGINILRDVYRAEQLAFQQVEQTLADRLNSAMGTSLSSLAGTAADQGLGSAAGKLISDALGGAQNPPLLPTLGSLAIGIELYYQGWVFKGFFEDFSVTESVSQGVGFFTYNMTFTVVDRRGLRLNFAPWHRSPISAGTNQNPGGYTHSDAQNTPMSFGGIKEE